MIVDEHEEYLEYISKYKHEWQEYEGLDPSLQRVEEQPDDTRPGPIYEQSTLGSGILTSGSEAQSDLVLEENVDSPLTCESEQVVSFDPYSASDVDARSLSTAGDISFPSLRDPDDGQTGNPIVLVPTISLPQDEEAGGNDGNAKRRPFKFAPVVVSSREPQGTFLPSNESIRIMKNNTNNDEESLTKTKSFGERVRDIASKLTWGTKAAVDDDVGEQQLLSPAESRSIDVTSIDGREFDKSMTVVGVARSRTDSNTVLQSSLGSPVVLMSPPAIRDPNKNKSPGNVNFFVEDVDRDGADREVSTVRRNVELFINRPRREAIMTRPSTPTRQKTPEMKQKAAKFDSPFLF